MLAVLPSPSAATLRLGFVVVFVVYMRCVDAAEMVALPPVPDRPVSTSTYWTSISCDPSDLRPTVPPPLLLNLSGPLLLVTSCSMLVWLWITTCASECGVPPTAVSD